MKINGKTIRLVAAAIPMLGVAGLAFAPGGGGLFPTYNLQACLNCLVSSEDPVPDFSDTCYPIDGFTDPFLQAQCMACLASKCGAACASDFAELCVTPPMP